MVRSVKGPRRGYRSPARDEQVDGTRRRAIEAAGQLFVERGYAGTTVVAVADAAGISPETIYASLRGKRGLLEGVIEAAIMGPEGAAVERQGWLTEVAALPDARERLYAWVGASCRTLDRTSPIHAVIRGAADREEFAVALRQRLLRRRLGQVIEIAGAVLGDDLRPGVGVEEAGERYAALVSPELYHLLVTEMGWAPGRCRDWLAATLQADLLGPDR